MHKSVRNRLNWGSVDGAGQDVGEIHCARQGVLCETGCCVRPGMLCGARGCCARQGVLCEVGQQYTGNTRN